VSGKDFPGRESRGGRRFRVRGFVLGGKNASIGGYAERGGFGPLREGVQML